MKMLLTNRDQCNERTSESWLKDVLMKPKASADINFAELRVLSLLPTPNLVSPSMEIQRTPLGKCGQSSAIFDQTKEGTKKVLILPAGLGKQRVNKETMSLTHGKQA